METPGWRTDPYNGVYKECSLLHKQELRGFSRSFDWSVLQDDAREGCHLCSKLIYEKEQIESSSSQDLVKPSGENVLVETSVLNWAKGHTVILYLSLAV